MTSTESRDATLQCTVSETIRAAFAMHAEVRGLSTAGLLRVLAESFIVSMELPATPPTRQTRRSEQPPEERVALRLAQLVTQHGGLSRSAAWRALAGRDRSDGGKVFNDAITFGALHGLFLVEFDMDGTGGERPAARLLPIT